MSVLAFPVRYNHRRRSLFWKASLHRALRVDRGEVAQGGGECHNEPAHTPRCHRGTYARRRSRYGISAECGGRQQEQQPAHPGTLVQSPGLLLARAFRHRRVHQRPALARGPAAPAGRFRSCAAAHPRHDPDQHAPDPRADTRPGSATSTSSTSSCSRPRGRSSGSARR